MNLIPIAVFQLIAGKFAFAAYCQLRQSLVDGIFILAGEIGIKLCDVLLDPVGAVRVDTFQQIFFFGERVGDCRNFQ